MEADALKVILQPARDEIADENAGINQSSRQNIIAALKEGKQITLGVSDDGPPPLVVEGHPDDYMFWNSIWQSGTALESVEKGGAGRGI